MAEKLNTANVNNNNKKLFLYKDGSPMIFFMRPCNERQVIQPIIEREGGRVTSKSSSDCIKLAEKGSMVSREGFISTRFIEDSVSKGELQDIEQYRITAGTRARTDSDSEHSVYSFASNDSMNPAPNIVKKSARSRTGGKGPYSKEEDLLIIEYLMDENRYLLVNKKATWVEMEKSKIIKDRSHDSLRCHYMRQMKPNLKAFKHDISPAWMNKLMGRSSPENQQEEEFSYDALFQQRPKKCAPEADTTTQKTSNKYNGEDKVKEKGQGDSGQKGHSLNINDENPNGNNNESSKDKHVQKSVTAFTKTREPLEFVQPDVPLRPQGKVNQISEKDTTTNTNQDKAENSKTNATDLKHQKTVCNRDKNDNNNQISKLTDQNIDKLTAQTNQEEHCKAKPHEQQAQREVVELLSDCDSDADDGSTLCGVQSVRLSYEDRNSSKDGDSQQTTGTKLTGISVPSVVAETDSDFDATLLAKSQKRKQSDSPDHNIIENRKSKRKCKNDSLATNDTTLSCKDLENSFQDQGLNASDLVSTSSVEYDAKSHQLIEIPPIVSDKCSEDSFDTMLRISVDVSKQGKKNGNAEHETSGLSDLLEKSVEQTIPVSGQQSVNVSYPTGDDDDASKNVADDDDDDDDGDDGGGGEDDEMLVSRTINHSQQSISTTVEERELTNCVDKCRAIAKVFSLSPEFVRLLLYRCTADENRVIAYIKYGPKSPELQPWKSREDALVLRDKFDRRLIKKYGIDEINDRIKFLRYEA